MAEGSKISPVAVAVVARLRLWAESPSGHKGSSAIAKSWLMKEGFKFQPGVKTHVQLFLGLNPPRKGGKWKVHGCTPFPSLHPSSEVFSRKGEKGGGRPTARIFVWTGRMTTMVIETLPQVYLATTQL